MSTAADVIARGSVWFSSVDLIELSGPLAARALIEGFGFKVNRFPIAQARHLVGALGSVESPHVVVDCHGVNGRIIVPNDLDPAILAAQPFQGSAGPDEITSFAKLSEQSVVCTGCETGDEDLARAFIDAGASCYIAPAATPEGGAALMAITLLFYDLSRSRPVADAVRRIRDFDAEGDWRHWS
jgi:hypothetical protein